MKRNRAVAALRLSRLTDVSTSPERQKARIKANADSHKLEVVGVADDSDSVSGAKPPWERPQLSAWLKRPDEFDIIIVDQLDRIGRDLYDFLKFQREYLEPKGKSLRFANPEIDLATSEGQMQSQMMMVVAENQRRITAEKTRAGARYARKQGRYVGGPVPYGYRKVRLAKGWGFAIDENTAPNARAMAERFLAGESIRSVTHWINFQGVRAPNAPFGPMPEHHGYWSAESVRMMLRSPAIAGIATETSGKNAEILRDDAGSSVHVAEGIVSFADWQRIRETMKANGHAGPRSNASDLLHVAYCGKCGAPMYSMSQTTRGKLYRYLKCARKIKDNLPGNCSSSVVSADAVSEAVSDVIMQELGNVKRRIRVVTPATDNDDAIAEATEAIANAVAEYTAGRMSAAVLGSVTTALEAKRARLAEESAPEVSEWRELDETFGEHWASLDDAGRHAFLVGNGVLATVMPEFKNSGSLPAEIEIQVYGAPEGYKATSVRIGRHRVFVWLGELESLRDSAAG